MLTLSSPLDFDFVAKHDTMGFGEKDLRCA